MLLRCPSRYSSHRSKECGFDSGVGGRTAAVKEPNSIAVLTSRSEADYSRWEHIRYYTQFVRECIEVTREDAPSYINGSSANSLSVVPHEPSCSFDTVVYHSYL